MMKKIVMLMMLIYSVSLFSQIGMPPRGERPDGPPPNGDYVKKERISVDDQVKMMTTDLNLNEVQQLKVRVLLLEQEKKQAIFSPNNRRERPTKEEIEAIIEDERIVFNEKLKSILTEEQFEKFSSENENVESKKDKKKDKKDKQ